MNTVDVSDIAPLSEMINFNHLMLYNSLEEPDSDMQS